MKSLLRILAVVVAAMCLAGAPARAERGEKSFGPRIGFASRNSSALGGLVFTYAFSEHFRVAPSVDIIFRNKDRDGMCVNIDAQFPFAFEGGRAAFYPLAGIGYTSWGMHNIDHNSEKDVTSHQNSLGLNVGGGFEYRCSNTLKVSIEARYNIIRHNPGAFIAAGIAYVF